MDDAVNTHLSSGNLGYESPRFVAESSCRYLKPLAYPTPIDVGLRLSKCERAAPRAACACISSCYQSVMRRLGRSSVAYQIGIFADGIEEASALGTFVHVYVDGDGRPTPLGSNVRELLEPLAAA